MNLAQQLENQDPDRIAIIDRRRQITFGELKKRVAGGARLLKSRGLQPGDPVLVLHPVTLELYEILLSCFHAGLVVVLIDPAQGTRFLEECLRWVPPKAFLGSPKAQLLRLRHRGLGPAISTGPRLPFTQRWKTLPTDGPPTELDGDHPALITFTSGSTGTPKGLVRSHRFLLSQDRILAPHLDLRPGQVDLVTLPVFLLSNLAHGVTSVIADTDLTRPGFPNAKRILAQVRKHHITRCTASPAFFAKMPDKFFDPLEQFHTGGAPVFPEVLGRFPEKARAVYGSSEAEPIAHFPGSALTPGMIEAIRTGAGLPAGRPVDDIEVRLVDKEILVTGDHVLKGYLDGRGDAKQKVKIDEQIWHRTGDAGRFDSRGNLWLLGRHHCKWRDYFPLQIEAAVHLQHPGQACAFHHGTLFLESDLPINLPWAPIDRIEVIPEIPMDRRHNAKIDHSRLTRRPA